MAYNLARRPLLVGGIPNSHEGFRIERMRARPPIRGAIRPGRGPKGGRRSAAHHITSHALRNQRVIKAEQRTEGVGSVRFGLGGQSTNQPINQPIKASRRSDGRSDGSGASSQRAARLGSPADGQAGRKDGWLVARRAGLGARRRRGAAGACDGSWREGATMTAQHRCGAQQQATRARRSSVARAWRRRGCRTTQTHT